MAKGGTFENEIAQKMSLWLTNGKSDECVRRTESSGARATQRSKKKKVKDTMFGDICASDPSVQGFFDLISLELKSGYYVSKSKRKLGGTSVTNWSFNDIIDSNQKTNVFFTFWGQCCNDASKSNREPILIFRRNQRKSCITMYSDLFEAFQKFQNHEFLSYYIEIKLSSFSITICNLDEFLKCFKYREALLRGPITKILMKRRLK